MVDVHFVLLQVAETLQVIVQIQSQYNLKEIKEKMHEKWHEGKYIAYFQAFTNTHAPVEVLKEKFEPVLKNRVLWDYLLVRVLTVYQTMLSNI